VFVASELHQLIGRVEHCMASEMTRYAIHGLLFESKGKTLVLCATDGHHLAHLAHKLDKAIELPAGGHVVPRTAIQRLQSFINGEEGQLRLQFGNNKVAFALHDGDGRPQTVFTATLLEGTFPPYDSVIPKDTPITVEINREQLLTALRQAKPMTNEESKGVRLAFKGNTLALSSRAAERGEAMIDVPCEVTGGDVEIGFNPEYLINWLKTIERPRVTMQFKSGNKPLLGKGDEGAQYVCMPINLQ
jgi:DNA polymerase-3 subunit beta